MRDQDTAAGDGRTENALIISRLVQAMGDEIRRRAFRDLRRGHARTTRLTGVMVIVGEHVVQSVEGRSDDLAMFERMLGASPCETGLRVLLRASIVRPAPRLPDLLTPLLTAGEHAWTARQCVAAWPDVVSLSSLLAWAGARDVEMRLGGVAAGVDPANEYPLPRAGQGLCLGLSRRDSRPPAPPGARP